MIVRQVALRQGHSGLLTQASSIWHRKISTNFAIETSTAATGSGLSAIATKKIRPNVSAEHSIVKRSKEKAHKLGSIVLPHYKPYQLIWKPAAPKDVTLELLMASQAHMGHATSLWNPANQRYIFGIRRGIHIISLEITAAYLRRAAKVVRAVTESGGLVLFVGTRKGQSRAVVNAAKLAGGCHLFERWIPGSLTNGEQILGACHRKIVNEFDEEVVGLEDQLVDEPVLKPDLVVCFNPLENEVLLHECILNHIPTIGVIDTNADPTRVTYPIPANDDSLRCIQVLAGVLGKAGQEGQLLRREAAEDGEVTYIPHRKLSTGISKGR